MIGSPFLSGQLGRPGDLGRNHWPFRFFCLAILLCAVDAALQFYAADRPLRILMKCLILLCNAMIGVSMFSPSLYNLLRGRTRLQEQMLFVGQLSDLLASGIAMPDALAALSSQARSSWRSHFSGTTRAVQLMASSSAAGDTLAQAMTRTNWFPYSWCLLLEAAENRGALVEVLADLPAETSKHSWLNAWMIWRLVVFPVFGLGIAFYLVQYILPTFVEIYAKQKLILPWMTRWLLGFVHYLHSPGYLQAHVLIATTVTGVAVAYYLSARFAALVQGALAGLPPFSLVLPLQEQARAAHLLASGLRLGLAEQEALAIATAGAQLAAYQRALGESEEADIVTVLRGHPMLFSAPLRWFAAQGQSYGNLAEALQAFADHLAELAEQRKERIVSALDAVATCLFGACVAFVILATMLPVVDFTMRAIEEFIVP